MGGARPPSFITFTITSKVAVYAPAPSLVGRFTDPVSSLVKICSLWYYPPQSTHRVATPAFWRTFHRDGKISPGLVRVGGCTSTPLSLNLTSRTKLLCTLQLRGQIHSPHRLNMEFDLQSLFGLHVHSCSHWLRPRNSPPSPRFWAHIRERYWSLVSQDIYRRHLFVTP